MTTEKTIKITPKSLQLFLNYASDAANWSGQPWVDGNYTLTKSERGNLTQLKKAGLLVTHEGEHGAYIEFTEAGLELAHAHNISIDGETISDDERVNAMTTETITPEVEVTEPTVVTEAAEAEVQAPEVQAPEVETEVPVVEAEAPALSTTEQMQVALAKATDATNKTSKTPKAPKAATPKAPKAPKAAKPAKVAKAAKLTGDQIVEMIKSGEITTWSEICHLAGSAMARELSTTNRIYTRSFGTTETGSKIWTAFVGPRPAGVNKGQLGLTKAVRAAKEAAAIEAALNVPEAPAPEAPEAPEAPAGEPQAPEGLTELLTLN